MFFLPTVTSLFKLEDFHSREKKKKYITHNEKQIINTADEEEYRTNLEWLPIRKAK